MRASSSPLSLLGGAVPAIALLAFFGVSIAIADGTPPSDIFLWIFLGGYILGVLLVIGSVIAVWRQHIGRILAGLHTLFGAVFSLGIIAWIVLPMSYSHYFPMVAHGQRETFDEQLYGLSILGAVVTVPTSLLLLATSLTAFFIARRTARASAPSPSWAGRVASIPESS